MSKGAERMHRGLEATYHIPVIFGGFCHAPGAQELQTRYLGSDENADATLEESLQEMSTELVKAQGLARHHRQQEEELRLELGKMKERIKATKDKLLYQEEHLKLQLETLQELDEQKIKGESEVELLTLGLHQQEEENQALLEANTQLLEEVSSRFGGNLEQWAGFSYEDQAPADTEGCGQNDASFNEMKSSPGFSASFATVLVRARPPLPSEAAYGHCVRTEGKKVVLTSETEAPDGGKRTKAIECQYDK
eukprot:symbB.v1.2.033438.t1/scaffold4153.1/size43791/1